MESGKQAIKHRHRNSKCRTQINSRIETRKMEVNQTRNKKNNKKTCGCTLRGPWRARMGRMSKEVQGEATTGEGPGASMRCGGSGT